MNGKLRNIAIIVLGCIFVGSGGMLVQSHLEDRASEKMYEESREEFVVVQQPTVNMNVSSHEVKEQAPLPEPGIEVDFVGLESMNKDIFGWIYIPDTVVNFPLLEGVDNQKYLTTAYNGRYSRFGSIFLDNKNAADMSDKHSVIHGHNLRNGAMFHVLLNYKDQKFFEAHPFIYILTETGYLKYEIFSAHTTTATGGIFVWKFNNTSTFSAFLKKAQNATLIQPNNTPGEDSYIITLSTCTVRERAEERFVVQAMLIEDQREQLPQ